MKLKELIGEIKEIKKIGSRKITETEKGCFTNVDLYDKYDKIDWLDADVTIHDLYEEENGKHVELDCNGNTMYLYGCLIDGNLKALSIINGDDRGCTLFGDVFIASGHDGSYMFNVKTGEFKDFS